MSNANILTTVAGIQLNADGPYVSEIDITNELEVVSRLRKLSDDEFAQGMSALLQHLNSVPVAFLADRYINLLVRMAGGELGESTQTSD